MNRTMSVAQLASYIKGVFDDEELLHNVTLTGEVAEISYSDRHTFITLAEGDFSVRCVRFNARDSIEKGAKIALRGSVRFYDKRGSVSFSYTEYYLCGDGEKAAKLAELKKRLQALGYFEDRPQLPRYITDVVALTSADGAAIRDLIRVVSDKSPFVRVRVYPVRVQGAGAAAMMTDAIKRLAFERTDAIVLCRGGGSDEDLDAFNDEGLATAVALSGIPVISAVGHEVDNTLCDFCAGTRAGTPSIAGEIINAHAGALINDLLMLSARAESALDQKLSFRTERFGAVYSRLSAAVRERVAEKKSEIMLLSHRGYYALEKKSIFKRERVSSVCGGMRSAIDKLLAKKRESADRPHALIRALDPHRIIKAGYAAVMLDGKPVTAADMLKSGNRIKLVFADGTAIATVEKVDK